MRTCTSGARQKLEDTGTYFNAVWYHTDTVASALNDMPSTRYEVVVHHYSRRLQTQREVGPLLRCRLRHLYICQFKHSRLTPMNAVPLFSEKAFVPL